MKIFLPFIAIGMLALAACEKGSVSGTVIDPFTGKAVELPTVYIKGTTFTSQKIPGGLPDGKFSFEGIEPGSYTLEAGKGKYSKGKAEFTITKENMSAIKDIYIYGQEVTPGLYQPLAGANAEKIINNWAIWQANCKGNSFALRSKFVENKKDNVLPPPKDVSAELVALYKIATSVTSPIEVLSYPMKLEPAKNHDCGVDAKETLLVPNTEKGTKLESSYKSDNLYEVKGSLPTGRQFLAISQDGKLVGLYYLNAK